MKKQYEVAENFQVETKTGGVLNLERGTIVLLSEEKAARFVGKLRPIDLSDYGNLYIKEAEQINSDHYPAVYGFIAWTRDNCPELWQQITDIEARMQTPIKDGLILREFSQLVNTWRSLHERAIKLYKQTAKGI